jgi:hypothetical protein
MQDVAVAEALRQASARWKAGDLLRPPRLPALDRPRMDVVIPTRGLTTLRKGYKREPNGTPIPQPKTPKKKVVSVPRRPVGQR